MVAGMAWAWSRQSYPLTPWGRATPYPLRSRRAPWWGSRRASMPPFPPPEGGLGGSEGWPKGELGRETPWQRHHAPELHPSA